MAFATPKTKTTAKKKKKKTVIGPFFGIFFKIDQTKQFQWSIMYSKVNQRLLNTFLILFSHFIHFLALQLTKKRRSWQNLQFFAIFSLSGPFTVVRPADLFWGDFSKLLQLSPNVICGSYKCLEDLNMFSKYPVSFQEPQTTFGDNWSNFEKSPQNRSAGLTTVKGPDRLKIAKNGKFCQLLRFLVSQRAKKWMKCKNNIRTMFSNL